MAVDAPQQGTRRSGRPKAVIRLLALLGLPLLVLVAIFAGGVYFGALRSYRIQTLEAEYLGMDPPTLPPASDSEPPEPPAVADASPTQPDAKTPDDQTPESKSPESKTPPDAQPPDAATPDAKPPETATPPQTSALPVAVAEPIGAELRSRYDEPLVVRVKLLVDPALVVAREDWLTYAASLIEGANASFQLLFGVEIRLQGVVVWDRESSRDPVDDLLADLGRHERDGAEVLLGLVAGTEPPGFVAPSFTGDVHGNQALVFADLRRRDRYYLNLLEALAGLLGAERTSDAAAKQLGSFMTDAEPPEGAAPVIDPDNRGRVIINKRRPFARTGAPRGPQQPEPGADDIPPPGEKDDN